jgi:hypothetical protein
MIGGLEAAQPRRSAQFYSQVARPKRFELLRGLMLSDSSISLFTPGAASFAAPLGTAAAHHKPFQD